MKKIGRVAIFSLLVFGIFLFVASATSESVNAELSSCSFFALTDDGTQIGPAPLRVSFFSIKASVGDLFAPEYGTGSVTFRLDFGDGTSDTATASMSGYAAQAQSTDHTYQNPGTYTVRLTATHTTGSSVSAQPVTIYVQGNGGGGGGGLVLPDLSELIYYAAPGVSLIAFIFAAVALVVAILPLPRHGALSLGTRRAAAPPRGKLKTGAPASMVQHLDSIRKIPPGARPLPHPRLHPGKFEPTDVLQKVPCPYCGTIVISAFGKWYCPNSKCKWNKGKV